MSEKILGEIAGDNLGIVGTKPSDGSGLHAARAVPRLITGGSSNRGASGERALREVSKDGSRGALQREVAKIVTKLEKLSEVVGKLERNTNGEKKGAGREKAERANRHGEKKLPAKLADVCSAQERRETPGRASGGEKLPAAREGWMRGSDKNAGPIPKQIADKLRGREFSSFNFKDGKPNPDSLAANIWKEIAQDPILRNEFAHHPQNLKRMENGFAPFVPRERSREFAVDSKAIARLKGLGPKGKEATYQIHHVKPIHRGGEVYDFDNLQIVNPQHHKAALDPRYHLGK